MYAKRGSGTEMALLWMITLSVCLLSCGDVDLDIDQEQTEEPLKFIEFVLFPTAPYIDKSYIEQVSEEELARREIDFEVEKQAIQEVYSNFIKAHIKEDMQALTKTLDRAEGIEYGTTTGIVYGWYNVKIYIEVNWGKYDCQGDPNWALTDFYIRPKNVKAPWIEASATGPMFYYDPGSDLCYVDIGRFYFTKRSNKWQIHQINGAKYFNDGTYRMP